MDTQNPGGLGFVVAGSGEDFADLVLFEPLEADQKISSGIAVIQGNFQRIRVPLPSGARIMVRSATFFNARVSSSSIDDQDEVGHGY